MVSPRSAISTVGVHGHCRRVLTTEPKTLEPYMRVRSFLMLCDTENGLRRSSAGLTASLNADLGTLRTAL